MNASVHQDLHEGVACHNAGRLDEAKALYIKVLRADPENADAWHLLGMIHLRTGDPGRALEHLRRALALNMTVAVVYNNMANVYGGFDNQPAAAACYERALTLNPHSPVEIFLGGAALQIILKRDEQAAATLRRAATLYPDNDRVWALLCYVAIRRDDYFGMHTFSAITARLQPGDATAFRVVGEHFVESGQFPTAHLFLTRAVEAHPELPGLNPTLAKAEALVGDKRKSLVRFWRSTNFNYVHRPQELLPETTVDAILDATDAVLPAALRDRECLIYPFNRFSLMGHLALEPLIMRQLHKAAGREIAIVTPPIAEHPRTNRPLLDIVMRGLHWVECKDYRVVSLGFRDIGAFSRNGKVYYFHTIRFIEREFYYHCMNGGGRADVRIGEDLEALGERLHRALGIPMDARVVVIHMREANYHTTCADTFSFRDVTVSNYLDAMRYLAARGYFVIRIGDRGMTPLPDMGPRVIDAPFDPRYEAAGDIYFLSKCHFMISSMSGPDDVARMFGRPVLAVNVPLFYNTLSTAPFEMFAFKRYSNAKDVTRRPLPFRQVLERGVQDMFSHALLKVANVRIEELTPDEILASVKEMEALLESGVSHTSGTPYFRTLSLQEDDRRRDDRKKQHNFNNWFGHGRSQALISDAYCDRVGFLND